MGVFLQSSSKIDICLCISLHIYLYHIHIERYICNWLSAHSRTFRCRTGLAAREKSTWPKVRQDDRSSLLPIRRAFVSVRGTPAKSVKHTSIAVDRSGVTARVPDHGGVLRRRARRDKESERSTVSGRVLLCCPGYRPDPFRARPEASCWTLGDPSPSGVSAFTLTSGGPAFVDVDDACCALVFGADRVYDRFAVRTSAFVCGVRGSLSRSSEANSVVLSRSLCRCESVSYVIAFHSLPVSGGWGF